MIDRREALEALVTHPGWQLFLAYVADEWGPSGKAYARALDKALDLLDDGAAASQARQVRAARRVIDGLVRWPEEELRLLKGAPRSAESVAPSRRGGLA